MVSVSELLGKITGREQELRQQQQQLKKIQPITQTKTQLLLATPQSQARIRQLQTERNLSIQQAQQQILAELGQVQSIETELEKRQRAYGEALKRQQEYNQGIDFAKRGLSPVGLSSIARKGFREYMTEKEAVELATIKAPEISEQVISKIPFLSGGGEVIRNGGFISTTQILPTDIVLKRFDTTIKQPQIQSYITEWKPEYETQYYQKPASQVAKEFLSILAGDIKQIPKREWEFRNPFEAFRGYGRRTSEIKSSQYSPVLKTGSISPTESPYYTYGELQRLLDVNKYSNVLSIQSKYYGDILALKNQFQADVNSRKIDINEAQNILDDRINIANQNINKELSKIKTYDYIQKGVQTGDIIAEQSFLIPEFLSLLTPATATLMGAYKFQKAEEKYPLLISSAEEGIPSYAGADVPFGEKLSASFFIGAGGLGAFGQLRATERAIVEEELRQLSEQPFMFKGLKIKGEPYDIDLFSGKQRFRDLIAEVKVAGKTYKIGDKSYIMPSGAGGSGLRGKLSWNILGGKGPTYIVGAQRFKIGSKGLIFKTGERGDLFKSVGDNIFFRVAEGDITGSLGVTSIIPTESSAILFKVKHLPKPFLSFPSPEIMFFKPFEEKKIAEYISQQMIDNYFRGGAITKELGFSRALKLPKDKFFVSAVRGDIGVVKVMYPKGKDVRFIRIIGGKKTPLSETFLGEPISFLNPATKSLTKTISKEVLKPTDSFINPAYSSVYAGTGLYEKYSPYEEIYPEYFRTILKPKPEELGGNMFKGAAPEGRIKSLIGTGKMSSLGALGKISDLGVLESRFKTGILTDVGLSTRQKERLRTENLFGTRGKQNIWTGSADEFSLRNQQSFIMERARVRARQEQIQPQKQLQRQRLNQITQMKTINPFFYPVMPSFRFRIKKKKRKKPIKIKKHIFIGEHKRFGQWKKVFMGKSFKSVLFGTKQAVQRDLSASLRIRLRKIEKLKGIPFSTKKTEKFLLLRPDKEFRWAKKSQKILVQKKPLRLKSIPERREIQFFRRKAKREKSGEIIW